MMSGSEGSCIKYIVRFVEDEKNRINRIIQSWSRGNLTLYWNGTIIKSLLIPLTVTLSKELKIK